MIWKIIFTLMIIVFATLAYTNFKLKQIKQNINPSISKFISNDDFHAHLLKFYSTNDSEHIAKNYSNKSFAALYFKGSVATLNSDLVLFDEEKSIKIQADGENLIFVTINELTSINTNTEISSDVFLLRQGKVIKSVSTPYEKQHGDIIFIHKENHLLIFILDENKAYFRKIYQKTD